MSEREEKLRSLIERLEQERDELKMKAGLAKLEAREEWKEMQEKLDGLRGRMKVLKDETRDASGDVGAAFEVVAEEIKDGLERIRKLI